MGSRTLLAMAAMAPERFDRLVVSGRRTESVRTRTTSRLNALHAGVSGDAEADDVHAQTFARYAAEPDQDGQALAAFIRRKHAPLGDDEFARITHPVRVVLGTEDFAGPADPLLDALADASFHRAAWLRPLRHAQELRLHRRGDGTPRGLLSPAARSRDTNSRLFTGTAPAPSASSRSASSTS